jgi:glycosyltransferase involved in cell wall biosynthesis
MTNERNSRRVLFFINSLARGGAETQLVKVARLTAEAGNDVAIVTLLGDNDFRDILDHHRLEVKSLGLAGLRSAPSVLWRAANFVRTWRPDVTIGFLYQATMLMRLLNILLRPDRSISSMRNERLENRWRSMSYFLTSFLDDLVVANSETARQRLVESRTVPASRSAVIYNGIDVDRYSVDPASKRDRVRQELGVSADECLFLGVGRLNAQKRWDLFVDAVAHYPGPSTIACAVAGEGPLEAELQHQIAQRGVSGQLTLLGLRHDVDALMAAADCLVLCSSHEGTPNVVLEAQAAGLRVIATEVGACAELLEGTDGVLVESGRADDLALAMAKVATAGQPARAVPDGSPTYDSVSVQRLRSRFSWESVGRNWLSLINDEPSTPSERQS